MKNESLTAQAFTNQSPIFDKIYSENEITAYMRRRVRAHAERYISVEAAILELNAGTGEDSIYLAKEGHQVYATDISEGMIHELGKKVYSNNLEKNIQFQKCSFTNLSELNYKGPFDAIFSNFGGLNCTDKLDNVLKSFKLYLKPGGTVTMAIMPPTCLWEYLLIFKGYFKTAFRRMNGKKGASAHIEGVKFKCWYYTPGYIRKALGKKYKLLKIEGMCTIVPPSYFERFPKNHPLLLKFVIRIEDKLKSLWPWKYLGDYFIISFQKK